MERRLIGDTKINSLLRKVPLSSKVMLHAERTYMEYYPEPNLRTLPPTR